MKGYMRIVALVLIFTMMILFSVSCAGKFALTHKLLDWNNGLNKWLGSFLMFVFIIIPVYGVCLLIDWIILNVIEFYSGNNPVSSSNEPTTKIATVDGKRVSMTMFPGDGININITTEQADGITKTLKVRTNDEGMTARVVEQDVESVITAKMTDEGIERCIGDACEEISSEQIAETVDMLQGRTPALASVY